MTSYPFDYYSLPLWIVGGLLGLCIGSFLNVVIYRLPIMRARKRSEEKGEKSLAPFNLSVPRSSCPKCGHFLRARENVPVFGWVFLRGKCHHCHNPISFRYPAIEFITGAAFLGFAMVFGFDIKTPLAWMIVCVVIVTVCIFYDSRRAR